MKSNEILQLEIDAMNRLSNFDGAEAPVNYEGGSDNYEGGSDNYIGLDDDTFDFGGGANSFMSEGQSNITYTFSITNASAATRSIALLPTYLGTAAAIATATGETVDGVLTDGTIITSVTGTAGNSKRTIAGMQAFVLYNPASLIRMTVKSNTEDGFLAQDLIYYELTPFRQPEGNQIPFTKIVDVDQYQQKKAVIDFREAGPVNMQLDNQRVLIFKIGGTNVVASVGESLTFTLEFGAINNIARTLAKKRSRAYNNISKMKIAGIIKGGRK